MVVGVVVLVAVMLLYTRARAKYFDDPSIVRRSVVSIGCRDSVATDYTGHIMPTNNNQLLLSSCCFVCFLFVIHFVLLRSSYLALPVLPTLKNKFTDCTTLNKPYLSLVNRAPCGTFPHRRESGEIGQS